jgi:4-hydroxy 2-oxovalerate aldolase
MHELIIGDTTLRDGSHAVSHSFSPQFVTDVVTQLALANVPLIEVSHGAGLQGSTIQQGFSTYDEMQLIEAAVEAKGNSKIASLFVPGIGTRPAIKQAAQLGIDVLRIAVHCTEANISQQYFEEAKNNGLHAYGFLMMSHLATSEQLAEEAQKMESYGADGVYVVDSAGALVPKTVISRVEALKEVLTIPVGFHAHNNLGLAIGNSLTAIAHGATLIDGTLKGLGAGAGNAALEVLIAALLKSNIDVGISLATLMNAAEEIVTPVMKYPPIIDRDNLASGYAGVYNSFLLHVREAAKKFDVDAVAIIEELGRRSAVAGQEDWIIEVAMQLASKKVEV